MKHYTSKELIKKMRSHGWVYDNLESYRECLRFFRDDGNLQFNLWKDVAEWFHYLYV